MNFKEYRDSQLNETNVAGGSSSAFGTAAGDGDTSTGWTDPKEVYGSMAITGTGNKKRDKKRKRKGKKKLPKMKETGSPEFGPVQSRNFPTDLMMPGRNKHIKETGEVQQEFVQAALPMLKTAGHAALNAGKLGGRVIGYAGGKALQGVGNVASKLGTMAAGAGAQTAAAMVGDEVPQNPTQTPMQMDAKQIDTLAGAAIAPLASLDKANFDKVYQKIIQGLNQMKTEITKNHTGQQSQHTQQQMQQPSQTSQMSQALARDKHYRFDYD